MADNVGPYWDETTPLWDTPYGTKVKRNWGAIAICIMFVSSLILNLILLTN